MANDTFSLRKLEMAIPLVKEVEAGNPSSFANLLSIVLADEKTLKLYAAGNKEALEVFTDEAYNMNPDDAAMALANFIKASQRFSSLLSGLPIEVLTKMEKDRKTKMDSLLQDVLPKE